MSADRKQQEAIVLVTASDDHFVMPLAVTVRSVLDNLICGKQLLLYVIDGGISQANKCKVESSLQSDRITIQWLLPDQRLLQNMQVSGHVQLGTYFRLLIPLLLPQHHKKAIYLDSDLLVLEDLNNLWEKNVSAHALLAVQDITAPYMCSSKVLQNYDRCGRFLSADTPLRNYQALGISPTAKYFNGGVLVINLEIWRKHDFSSKILQYLEQNQEFLRWWDQDGLNALLADKWGQLDHRWNQLSHIYRYPSWQESPLPETVFRDVLDNPYIIHFAAQSKPWHATNLHPRKELFFVYLDKTVWKGWRPKITLRKRIHDVLVKHRRVKQIVRYCRRIGRKIFSLFLYSLV